MRVTRVIVMAVVGAGCAGAAATNVRTPLGAHLSTGAKTGAPVALRADPNTKVILSNAANLPPASYSPSQATRGKDIYDRHVRNVSSAGAIRRAERSSNPGTTAVSGTFTRSCAARCRSTTPAA